MLMSRAFKEIDGELVYFCKTLSPSLMVRHVHSMPCAEKDEQKRSADQALAPPRPSSSDVPGGGHTRGLQGAAGTPAGLAQAQGRWETKGAPHF